MGGVGGGMGGGELMMRFFKNLMKIKIGKFYSLYIILFFKING